MDLSQRTEFCQQLIYFSEINFRKIRGEGGLGHTSSALLEFFENFRLDIFKDSCECWCFATDMVTLSDVDFCRKKINKFNTIRKFNLAFDARLTFHLAKILNTQLFPTVILTIQYYLNAPIKEKKYLEKVVGNMEVLEICRFELWEVT